MPRFLWVLLATLLPATILPTLAHGADWLQFRGSQHNSTAEAKLPKAFDTKTKQNIAWQADLPGRGPSSPIAVRDRIILTASDGARQEKLYVLAFDAKAGKELWRRQFWATGRTMCHPESANAAPTPASDGERIFAFYSSNDLICLDLQGNLLWYRGLAFDYPKAGNDVGMAASPVVAGDTVVVQIENQGDSFAAGLNTSTGEERWRIARKPLANWSSPIAIKTKEGGEVVVLQDGSTITGVHPQTGEIQWKYELPCSETTSTTVRDGKLFVPANGVTALDLASSPSAPKLLWDSNKIGTSGSSPVVTDNMVYSVNRAGVLACADIKTGEVGQQLRLKGPVWASPIIADGHLYLISFEGLAHIVKLGSAPGEKATLLGTADFGERIQGTPAVLDNALFVRSDTHLWKIAE
ncbi:MAG TPA: PQQ-binding-like beta-propeller repeat protein [Pirellulaceae bacterium]|nr:PQQ-binding-like beta-propeller repeat protein [Pirellulaceae bacterium]